MNLALVYDSETTGLPLWSEPSSDPRQPHLVQLAALMLDLDTGKTVASMDVTVRPSGWTIPDEVAFIHGITTERAAAVGIDEEVAVATFLQMWMKVDDAGGFRIGHNESFDARILRIGLQRYIDDAAADYWKVAAAECTAQQATPIMALPPTPKMVAAKRHHHKTPNLREAYQFFTGAPLENAHTAMADARACLDVWLAIRRMRDDGSRSPSTAS